MVTCPECKSDNLIRRGYNLARDRVRTECKGCGGYPSFPIEAFETIQQDFKIGVVDIEVLPGAYYSFGMRDQYLSGEQQIYDICLLSWAGKYLNSSELYSDILTPKEARERNPERITKSAHEFVSSCQIVIGHNYRSYDAKVLNNYFLLYANPVKHLTIDTLEAARNNFRFSSNKLKDINRTLGIPNKVDNSGMPLWIACNNGDQSALDSMDSYNRGDIIATESLYYKIRGFIPNHPNLARYNNLTTKQCPNCLGTEFTKEGEYPAGQGMYSSLRCNECGSLHRYGENTLSKKKRDSLMKA